MFLMDVGPLPCHAVNAELRLCATRQIDLLVKLEFFGKLFQWWEDKRLKKILNSFWLSRRPTIRFGVSDLMNSNGQSPKQTAYPLIRTQVG